MPPGEVTVILLADRGFGRTERANTCRDLGLRYLIRIGPDLRVTHPSYTGRLEDSTIQKGMWWVPAGSEYRSDGVTTRNAVISGCGAYQRGGTSGGS